MEPNITPADLVTQIARQIIERAGLTALPPEMAEDYQERLAIEIQRRIGLISLKMLDEDGRKKMEEWSKTAEPTPEAMVKFFQDNVPDYEARLAEVLEQFAQEMVGKLQVK